MALPTYDEYLKQFEENRAKMDQYYEGLGFVRVGNKYVKNPSFQSETDQLKDLNSLDPVLSLDEAERLGVPAGTRQSQVAGKAVPPKPSAAAAPSATEREGLADAATTLEGISRIEGLLGDPNIDTGRSQWLKQYLRRAVGPTFPGLKQSDREQQLQFTLSNLSATFRKFLSGAAVTDQERAYLEQNLLPNLTDTRQEITNKLNSLRNFVQSRQSNIQKQLTPTQTAPAVNADPLGLR